MNKKEFSEKLTHLQDQLDKVSFELSAHFSRTEAWRPLTTFTVCSVEWIVRIPGKWQKLLVMITPIVFNIF